MLTVTKRGKTLAAKTSLPITHVVNLKQEADVKDIITSSVNSKSSLLTDADCASKITMTTTATTTTAAAKSAFAGVP